MLCDVLKDIYEIVVGIMQAPFDLVPIPQLPYTPDEFVLGTLARAPKDWPNFDDLFSLPAILLSAGSA